MHERPGPQYNRGNDPTTGVCILKNATQKKWYLRFWNIFFFILRWRAESPVVFSGVSRGGGGRVRCPLSFRPKRGPKVREKFFFFETGPPLYLRIWMTQPHPLPPPPPSEGLNLPLQQQSYLGLHLAKQSYSTNLILLDYQLLTAFWANVKTT